MDCELLQFRPGVSQPEFKCGGGANGLGTLGAEGVGVPSRMRRYCGQCRRKAYLE